MLTINDAKELELVSTTVTLQVCRVVAKVKVRNVRVVLLTLGTQRKIFGNVVQVYLVVVAPNAKRLAVGRELCVANVLSRISCLMDDAHGIRADDDVGTILLLSSSSNITTHASTNHRPIRRPGNGTNHGIDGHFAKHASRVHVPNAYRAVITACGKIIFIRRMWIKAVELILVVSLWERRKKMWGGGKSGERGTMKRTKRCECQTVDKTKFSHHSLKKKYMTANNSNSNIKTTHFSKNRDVARHFANFIHFAALCSTHQAGTDGIVVTGSN